MFIQVDWLPVLDPDGLIVGESKKMEKFCETGDSRS